MIVRFTGLSAQIPGEVYCTKGKWKRIGNCCVHSTPRLTVSRLCLRQQQQQDVRRFRRYC